MLADSVTACLTASATSGVAAALLWRFLVPRLPEPWDPDPRKPRYDELTTRGRTALVGLMAAATGAEAWLAPHPARGALLVLAAVGTPLVATDALTTYLPRRQTWQCAASVTVAAAITAPHLLLLHGLLGALAAALVFWVFWRSTGALGFGDVRLALPLGMAAALLGPQGWLAWLVCGTAAGALWGSGAMLWRRRHPSPWASVFPYGPGLWLGLWPAALWVAH